MARQKLEDVVSYLETQSKTNVDLKDMVRYTERDARQPPVRRYGVHIYMQEDPLEEEQQHIGNNRTEFWSLNVDIVINRKWEARKSISDVRGVSYWVDTTKTLFLHGTNGGVFEDSFWELDDIDTTSGDYTVLKGHFICEILNQY